MSPKTSKADFEALVRRAALPLTAAQVDELYLGWGHFEPMLERVRTPSFPREAELSLVFRPEESA